MSAAADEKGATRSTEAGMSQWWDEDAGRYRSTLVYKIFYVWGWPMIRAVMFRLPPETAHHTAIRGLLVVGWIDRVWRVMVLVAVVSLVLLLRLLAFLPGFSWQRKPG